MAKFLDQTMHPWPYYLYEYDSHFSILIVLSRFCEPLLECMKEHHKAGFHRMQMHNAAPGE